MIKITKLAAVKRQLRTAILLWFADEDPVSVHTLISAAHEILQALYKRAGLTDLLIDSRLVKEDKRRELAKAVKAAANFFKHADRDPEGTFDFRPDMNPILFVFVGMGLDRMGESHGDVENAFFAWFGVHNPGMLVEDANAKNIAPDDLEALRSLTKREFLTMRLPPA